MSDAYPQEHQASTGDRLSWLDSRLTTEILLYVAIFAIACFTRFYDLGARVMSHDETTHVYFSWLLEQGQGYQHDPLSHGPLQFHLVALSYFLFGASDAAARIPAAIFGVLAIGLLWLFRKWLGRSGAFIAALLILISPYMLYYSRYTRNEALVVPLVLLTVWAIFKYFEDHKPIWLYVLAFVSTLHFATKETSFIFTAQVLLFLGAYLTWRLVKLPWKRIDLKITFIVGIVVSVVGAGLTVMRYLGKTSLEAATTPEVLQDTVPEITNGAGTSAFALFGIPLAITLIGLILFAVPLLLAYGRRLRTDFPALDLIIVLFTMTLPQLASLPATIIGWNPLAYQDPIAYNRTLTVVIVLIALSAALGLIWNWRRWVVVAAIFYIPFLILFTTIFTNGQGVATGLVGSLGYWLVQHSVERGSQPHFYYALVQIPIYEFLPALGALMAFILAFRKSPSIEIQPEEHDALRAQDPTAAFPALAFFVYWALSTLLAYSFAGERMPWITVHITLPLILLAGWALGQFFDSMPWAKMRRERGWLVGFILFVILLATLRTFGLLLSTSPPFQGKEIHQLSDTMNFIAAIVVAVVSALGLATIARGWIFKNIAKLAALMLVGVLALITARSAFRAAFVNYDLATEFLVYAHMAPGPKIALEQIEDLSIRTTGGKELKIAYDNETTYPYWWYFRDYSQVLFFGSSPSREILNYPVVVAGDVNYGKVDPLLSERYYTFEYTRIWWPNQDYFQWNKSSIEAERNAELRAAGLTDIPPMNAFEYVGRFIKKTLPFLTDREARSAAWDVWFNRDFRAYFQYKDMNYSLQNWSPSNRMKLYIRKDVAALIWDYGEIQPEFTLEEYEDPYIDKMVRLGPDQTLGPAGSAPGEFDTPRGLAYAPDDTLYIADSINHRIQHISPDGEVLHVWGQYASIDDGEAPGGTFNEPWGITIGPNGDVYVADTWNHRIQHFTSDGQFLNMFGTFGQAETLTAFYGPRSLAVDSQDRLYVSDTGNKRIVVFDSDGNPLTSFGGFGLVLGSLDEPVGIAIDEQDRIYVVDTWNQRIQVFEEFEPNRFEVSKSWLISGWYGQSLDNKPYVAIAPSGDVCVSDPEGPRVLCFDPEGGFLTGWGAAEDATTDLGIPIGLAFDSACGLWVSDSINSRLMHFSLEICQD
jgi:predicted membrane-bound mannosyltransferase/sugar lactone lactonase YvrE